MKLDVLIIYKSFVWICFKCSLYERWHMYNGLLFSEKLQYHMQNKTSIKCLRWHDCIKQMIYYYIKSA